MDKRKRIGEVLIESGIINQRQLEDAIVFQKGKNKRLGKILVELDFATEKQIAEALSKALSIPLVNCLEYTINEKVKSLVPQAMAAKKIIMPLEVKDNTLILAMADPLDYETIDSLAFSTDMKIVPVITYETNLLETIEKHYGASESIKDMVERLHETTTIEFLKITEEDEKEVDMETLHKKSETPTVINLVTTIIVDAVKTRATDIHIEPAEKDVRVRYRIDGELKNILSIPKNLQNPVISRIKIISNMDITNRKLPQDGNSSLRIGRKEVDLRISTIPSIHGEKIVIRLLEKAKILVPLHQLGMTEKVFHSLADILSQPQGMFIVTGPTGSGKTSTLYASIKQLQSETENIITIEDPVEIKLEGITQVLVNEKVGLTFSNALRSILRQDPDIILVGEIRDLETADTAIKAALTGHFVLSTLHTNNTVSTITRLIDIGVPSYLIGSALSGILAQRLVRKICNKCKIETKPPVSLMNTLPPLERCYYGVGCPQCFYTGYYGQIGVFEFLKIDIKLKRLIARNATEEDIWHVATESGIVTLFDDAWNKINDGVTTIAEVLSKVPTMHNGKNPSDKAV